MNVNALKVVCFSPTGTSKKIANSVAGCMDNLKLEMLDITNSDTRSKSLDMNENELLVIAVPVYAGRVPVILQDWLSRAKGHNTPAVCLVVYGNRAFEDALLELSDSLTSNGFKPIAGAAFIGEHSFSAADTPIAVDRPDAEDISKAKEFGRQVREKLQAMGSLDASAEMVFPGNHPYKELVKKTVDFIELSDACTKCGVCETACPVNAIDIANNVVCNIESCIRCCACIKSCPEHARTIHAGAIKDIAKWLFDNCAERREPELFL